jgi:ribonuclease-3 family protein
LPKHATAEEYMYSTAFEALIGYLFLLGKDERLDKILKECIEIVDNNN